MAWEIKGGPDILVGILHTWNIHPDWAMAMLRLTKTPFGKKTVYTYRWEHDRPYDLARNYIAKEVLNTGATWLFSIDTDVIPPPDALERLLSHNQPIVSALYYRRHPKISTEAFRYKLGTTQLDPVPRSKLDPGLNEVDAVGMGCCLIHRNVFESLADKVRKLQIPSENSVTELYEFYKFCIHEPPYLSEDLYFCVQARSLGWRVLVDVDIDCGHIISSSMVKDGKVEFTPLGKGA